MGSVTNDLLTPASPAAVSNTTKVVKVAGAALGLSSGFATLYFGTLSVFMRPMAEAFFRGVAGRHRV